jgi:hypothetical protein
VLGKALVHAPDRRVQRGGDPLSVPGQAAADAPALASAVDRIATALPDPDADGLTAGALDLVGAVRGPAGAYAGLGAGYADDLGALRPVPVANLLTIAIGLQVVTAAVARLLAGREPLAVSGSPTE